MSDRVIQLRSQVREQASNQPDAGLKRLLEGVLADMDGNSSIPDYKREDVLKQLKIVLDGGGSASDKQHAVGEIRARWTTLGNIFAPELADVMAKHRKFVKKEYSKDEANEPAYIDEAEKRFGIQIHGDPGEDAMKIFSDSLARLMPYEKDVIELIPSVNLSGQDTNRPSGGFMASVNMMDFVLRMEGRLDAVVIAHELTHHKEALVNLREATQGDPLLQKRLLKINPPEEAKAVAKPDMSVVGTEDEKIGKRIEPIKAKFAVSPEFEKLLKKLFSSGFEPVETDDKNVFLRWTKIAEAIFKAEFPDPEKPWRVQDWIEIALRLQNERFSMPNELVGNYMAMSAAEDDADWEGMDRKEIEKYLKSRIIEKLSKKFGISDSAASYVVESEWLLPDVRNAPDKNKKVITYALNAIESLPVKWRPFFMWVVFDTLGNTGASKNISEDEIKQLVKLVSLCEGRFPPGYKTFFDTRTEIWKDVFAISLGRGHFESHFDSLSNLVTSHKRSAAQIRILSSCGFDPSVILRSLNGEADEIESICRSSIELLNDVPEKKAVFLRSIKEDWPNTILLRDIGREMVAKLFLRDLIEASDVKLVISEYSNLEYYLFNPIFKAATISTENLKYLISSYIGSEDESLTREIIKSYLGIEKLKPGRISMDAVKKLIQHPSREFAEAMEERVNYRSYPLGDSASFSMDEKIFLLVSESVTEGYIKYVIDNLDDDLVRVRLNPLTILDLDIEKISPERKSFLAIAAGNRKGFDELFEELKQERESKKTQEIKKTRSVPAEPEFDLSVDGFAGRYGRIIEDGYGKIIEPLAMGFQRIHDVGQAQEASARAVARKLARITKDTSDDGYDFAALPLKSVFEYLLYTLSSSDVDIETGLKKESPEMKGKIDSMRSWWMGAALYLCPSAVSWFTGLGESELMAFRKIVKGSDPLSIGDIRRMYRQTAILGGVPIDELDVRPEQLTTIVAFYRTSPEDFVKKVFEKDGQGNYLHPKTIQKVVLCQEYGFLPAVL